MDKDNPEKYLILNWNDAVVTEIENCWNNLEKYDIKQLAEAVHPPHITLATFTSADINIEQALATLCNSCAGIPLTSACLSFFPLATPTIFLGITPSAELIDFQRKTLALLRQSGAEILPYYTEDQWLPHSTLAFRIENKDLHKALDVCSQSFNFPIKGYACELSLIIAESAETIWTQELFPPIY